MHRPEAKNAIGKDLLRGFRNAIEDVSKDSSANVVLIRSSVPKVFCAGADLKVNEWTLLFSFFTVRLFDFAYQVPVKSEKYAKYLGCKKVVSFLLKNFNC